MNDQTACMLFTGDAIAVCRRLNQFIRRKYFQKYTVSDIASISDVEIVEALKSYDKAENPKGETLPEEQRLYRIRVVRTFLLAGVPLNKLHIFKELLEEHAYRLTDRRRMSDIIPFVLKQEKEEIGKEINEKSISISFDGTSWLGEVFVIVVRFVPTESDVPMVLECFDIISSLSVACN